MWTASTKREITGLTGALDVPSSSCLMPSWPCSSRSSCCAGVRHRGFSSRKTQIKIDISPAHLCSSDGSSARPARRPIGKPRTQPTQPRMESGRSSGRKGRKSRNRGRGTQVREGPQGRGTQRAKHPPSPVRVNRGSRKPKSVPRRRNALSLSRARPARRQSARRARPHTRSAAARVPRCAHRLLIAAAREKRIWFGIFLFSERFASRLQSFSLIFKVARWAHLKYQRIFLYREDGWIWAHR